LNVDLILCPGENKASKRQKTQPNDPINRPLRRAETPMIRMT